MSLKIRRACVLGAGVMGAQIAAHLAAAGIRTHLLDLETDELPEDPKLKKLVKGNPRSSRAIIATEQLKKLKPPPLASTSILGNIICGNFADDMSVISDCDWVIEAVVERLDIKKSIHKSIAEYVRPGVPVCTNTSGIPLRDICKDMSEPYQQCFMGSHFFNPPRYMNLLEMIPHGLTDMALFDDLCSWVNLRLGKGIVRANDTINFIANRIGVMSLQSVLQHMGSLKIETVDAITGPLIGHPKSASFRTLDVVGLDTFAHVAHNVYSSIKDDPYHSYFKMPDWIDGLIQSGATGQKSKLGGFYKKNRVGGKSSIQVFRPESKEYVEQEKADIPWMKEAKKISNVCERLSFIFEHKDEYANFIWNLHKDVWSYSALLLEEIASGSPRAIDDGMRWGFNWELGPFELWQGVGYQKVLDRLQKEDVKLPDWVQKVDKFYDQENEYILPKNTPQKLPRPQYSLNPDKPVAQNKGATLVDLGDGIACLAFHTKMNTLNTDVFEMMQKSIAAVSENFDGLVVSNHGEHFSAGADLSLIFQAIENKDWKQIDEIIRTFQACCQLLKYAPFPSVAGIHGLTLGGGCEVALHCSEVVAYNDTFAGLVEVGVGLLPAGGGTKELAIRAYERTQYGEKVDASGFLQRAFLLIGMGQVSGSALDAKEKGLFPESTVISMSKEHLISRAKSVCKTKFDCGYMPPSPNSRIKVLGDPGLQTFKMMLYNMSEGHQISAYDAFVGESVARILCGGEVDGGTAVSEQYLLELERVGFVQLCQQEKTKERIMHMLKTGKPLRN